MQSSLVIDLLDLYFKKCGNDPQKFVINFNDSDYIIGFNYCFDEARFTHVSNSFQLLLGYHMNNILDSEKFVNKLLHPQDRTDFLGYLKRPYVTTKNKSVIQKTEFPQIFKFKVYHVNGYWKHFIMYAINYFNHQKNSLEKLGLLVNERLRNYQNNYLRNNKYMSSNIRGSNYSNHSEPSILFSEEMTPRESEILNLLGIGYTTKEIADQLCISYSTVLTHRRNMLSKFHVHNTPELIRLSQEKRLTSIF